MGANTQDGLMERTNRKVIAMVAAISSTRSSSQDRVVGKDSSRLLLKDGVMGMSITVDLT